MAQCVQLWFCMSSSTTSIPSSKLVQGISYFEEILQLMPNDRSALEFLAVAYEQSGDRMKRNRVVCTLADVLIAEKDLECAEKLLQTLQDLGTSESFAAYNRIKAVLRQASASATSANPAALPGAASMLPAVKSELELVHELQAHEIISNDTAKIVEQSLYGTLSSSGDVLISALLFIKNENPAECENAMTYLANTYQAPPIPVKAFEQNAELLAVFPGTILGRGVMPLANLGDTLLVAMLNPADKLLRKQISDKAGKPCQIFLAAPAEMEAALS